ncbi:MAG: hypothetical protein ACI92I_000934 [Acidimicrobiales bacterium]|jgi:hypothetical protein
MENEQIPTDENVVAGLPKWVKILFRFYAVVFLLGTIVVGAKLLHSYRELTNAWGEGIVPTSVIIAVACVILILEILYGIGIYRLKRWVLPITLTFSFSMVLIGLLNLINQNFTNITELIGSIIGISFMGLVGFASIKHWNTFGGSSRKLLIQVPLLLALLPLFLLTILTLLFPDDQQINDSDLILQPVEVLSEFNNAHYSLPDIDNLSVQELENYKSALTFARELDESDANSPEAISLVNQTRGLTDSFIAASYKQGYQCPTTVNNYSVNARYCNLNYHRSFATLTTLRTAVEADTGNSDQAIETAMSVIRMGSFMGNYKQSELLEYFTGIAMMKTGFESLERTLNNSTSTSNQAIISAISELEQLKVSDTAFANSLRKQYMTMKDASKTLAPFNNYLYQHNKTLNDMAESFRIQIPLTSLGCDTDTTVQKEEVEQHINQARLVYTPWSIVSPNIIGKTLSSVVIVSFNSAGERRCKVNNQNQAVQELLQNNITTELESQDDDPRIE